MNSNNTLKAVLILILINLLLAILPHLLVKPFWIPRSEPLKYVTLFEAIYTLLILPLTLLWLNKKINKKLGLKNFVINGVLILISIFLSNHFHYLNFADMTGKGDNPDQATAIAKIVVLVGGLIVSGIGITIKLYKETKNKDI